MRNNQPFSSSSRSKPYVLRNEKRVTATWMGIFNIIGLVYPRAWEHPDVHVRMTNNLCEQYAI
jgi:hypothetical protein